MDPYGHIRAKYPGLLVGDVRGVALALRELPPEDIYRVANDLLYLLDEVERLRAIETAAREVLDAHSPYPGTRWVAGTPLHGLSEALAGK